MMTENEYPFPLTPEDVATAYEYLALNSNRPMHLAFVVDSALRNMRCHRRMNEIDHIRHCRGAKEAVKEFSLAYLGNFLLSGIIGSDVRIDFDAYQQALEGRAMKIENGEPFEGRPLPPKTVEELKSEFEAELLSEAAAQSKKFDIEITTTIIDLEPEDLEVFSRKYGNRHTSLFEDRTGIGLIVKDKKGDIQENFLGWRHTATIKTRSQP